MWALHSRVGSWPYLQNIILGGKSHPGSNTLAYNKNYNITTIKRFITLGAAVDIIKNIFLFHY
jgi:hypothetical protein